MIEQFRLLPFEEWEKVAEGRMRASMIRHRCLHFQIHLSMSVGHSFAGVENGYSVFGGREAKGCVDAKLASMPVV